MVEEGSKIFGHFYNRRVVKATAVFGALFDNIYIVQKDSTGAWNQVKVPFSYGPKRKFLERIAQMDNGEESERRLAIKLPRISFEMVGLAYDPGRQLPKRNSYKRSTSDPERMARYFVSTPYVISWQVSVYGKRQDDCLQIIEQILPYFNPEYNVSMKPYDGVEDISEDMPITLTGVSNNDDYEGEMASRRTIVYTLDFDMKLNFYYPKPVPGQEDKIIRKVNNVLRNYDYINSTSDSDGFLSRIEVTPNPLDVSPDSDFSLIFTVFDSA